MLGWYSLKKFRIDIMKKYNNIQPNRKFISLLGVIHIRISYFTCNALLKYTQNATKTPSKLEMSLDCDRIMFSNNKTITMNTISKVILKMYTNTINYTNN